MNYPKQFRQFSYLNYQQFNAKTLKSQRIAGIFGFLTHIPQGFFGKNVYFAQQNRYIFYVFTQNNFFKPLFLLLFGIYFPVFS